MIPPQVIALVQEKGGSGKSTLLATLASLMHEDGAKVAVIDSYPLSTASDFVKSCNKQNVDIDHVHCTDENNLPKLGPVDNYGIPKSVNL